MGWYIYNVNYHFVANTDLDDEQIGSIQLGDSLTNVRSTIDEKFETITRVKAHKSVISNTFAFSADQTDKIIYIRSESEEFKTAKGITVGASIEDVRLKYGDDYIQVKEMGMGNYRLYVDRKSNTLLRFWYDDDTVKRIVYEYLD
ncbi:hypothetical protein [Bacillus solimangrovi]|uniref:hypothetical protein n=1 Tax=Bacillus solimangrovi TaxID=1305675 RepID=UPI001112CC30|nr:hypothetical protein [Bacillus solimangrovi]